MKRSRVTAAWFATVSNPLALLGPVAGFTASLGAALPARGAHANFTERVISTTADGANSVFATDMDGDGDIDVLSASRLDDKIAWYENDGGSPPSFTERVISTNADEAYSVFATDLDGDGDIDVLSVSWLDDKIAWYESDGGSPPSFTERVISITADGATAVFATDVDGDGDTDVLSASRLDDTIAWYESDGGSPPTFTERVISTTARNAQSVFATDVDGDGDIDILSASSWDRKIAWYENDGGSPPRFTQRAISFTADRAVSVFATDVDGDGDTDVLSASWGDDKIAWYESNGGSPPTFTERVISTTADLAVSVFATDLDGDGDIDVLSASLHDDKIAWYENTAAPCGDGLLFPDEECDDENHDDGDGCSSACMVEKGFGCTGQPSVCFSDCNGNGIPDQSDIENRTSEDENLNGIPDRCDIVPLLEPDGRQKNRFVSYMPAGGDFTTAIRIKLVRMYVSDGKTFNEQCRERPPELSDLSTFEGEIRWVGTPESLPETQGDDPNRFVAAPLQCEPYFANWPAELESLGEDVLHTYGSEIVPCSIYEVQAVSASCPDLADERCYSEPLVVHTARYGDVNSDGGLSWNDMHHTERKFLNSFAPSKVETMLRGNVPPVTTKVNWLDLALTNDGNVWRPYLGRGPDMCPGRIPECGDGILDPGEQCDDGNTEPGDGCAGDCRIEIATAIISLMPVNPVGTDAPPYPPDVRISGNEITLPFGGIRVWLELTLTGWDPGLDGDLKLAVWQATIDSSGYAGNVNAFLEPAVEVCFYDDSHCEEAFGKGSRCTSDHRCTPTFNESEKENSAFNVWSLIDSSSPESRYGSGPFCGASYPVTDDGSERYGGTLVLDVSLDAVGTFIVGFDPDPESTFMLGEPQPARSQIPIAGLEPAIISIQRGCCPKNRAISFSPSDLITSGDGAQQAIRVRLADLDGFESFNGQIRWMGPPAEFSEDTTPLMPNFVASPLQCCPYFRDWSQSALAAQFGSNVDVVVVHGFGVEVVPSSKYVLQVVDSSCADLSDEACYAEPWTIITAKWGDVWAPYGGEGQPNFTDIGKVVDKFKAIPYDPGPPESGAPPKVRAMLRGNVPPLDSAINFTDIGLVVEGFKEIPYSEPGPSPCDPCP